MISCEQHSQGTILLLRVHPAARKNEIRGTRNGALQISVTSPPEKGKANRAVEKLLAKALRLPKSRVAIVSGETSRDKKALILGCDGHFLKEALAAVLSG